MDALPDTVSKAALTTGHWKRSLTRAGSQVTPAASCPSRLDASHPAPCVCVSTAGAGWLRRAGSHHQKSCPVLALLFTKAKAKGRSVPDHPPPHPPRPGRTWQTGCSLPSPSTLSQDIPAHEEHARRANPSGNAGIRHRGAWAIQEWEPDQGCELDRSSPGWPARLGLQ